jgi:peroxiredoxin
MFGLKRYNYDQFTRDLVMRDYAASKMGGGLEAGERAPDFHARTLDGDRVRLSDFEGEKNVVLTFGSATDPMTAASIEGMNDLYDQYNGGDVQFFFVYAREGQPGERLPAHRSLDDKIRAAEVLRDEEDVEMPILIDELNGSIHKKFSKLPNPTFIIDKAGKVAFRCLWTQPDIVEEALEELLERQEDRGVDHVVVRGGEDASMPKIAPLLHAHRALERGGQDALDSFQQAFGKPGRVAVTAGRVVRPVAENPGKVLVAAALTAGVIAGGVLAGKKLRERRLRERLPYDVHETGRRRRAATGTDDYEPVGI